MSERVSEGLFEDGHAH